MMKTTLTYVFLIFTIAVMASGRTESADILYFEDFSSGNAARSVWQERPSARNFDASSGDYVLNQPDGETAVNSFVTGVPEVRFLTDTSVRAQVGQEGALGYVAVFARSGAISYQGGFNADTKRLVLGWNDPGFTLFESVDFDYDMSNADLVLQLDVIDNNLSLWAWNPDGDVPAVPQLTFTDDRRLARSGAPGVLIDPVSPGTPSTAVFRYIQVADSPIPIPEPSTYCMLASAMAGLFTLRHTFRGSNES